MQRFVFFLYNSCTISSLMKGSQHSLNKIYADPHIVALANRIKFIQKRRARQLIQVQPAHSSQRNENSLGNLIFQPGYKKRSLRTEGEAQCFNTKRQKQQNNSCKTLLKELKTARYRQCKENSERNLVLIRQNRQREMDLKRIKRSKVLVSQQRRRMKLQQFQKQKMNQLHQRNNHQWAQQQVQLKKMELKKQLIAEEDKFLNLFQDELAHKSVLIKKIKTFLRSQSEYM